jgi:hypothetical protein
MRVQKLRPIAAWFKESLNRAAILFRDTTAADYL